jgi:CRP-like cAMP-binding protein
VDSNTSAEFCKNFSSLADELGKENVAKFLKSASVLELPAERKLIKVGITVETGSKSIALGNLGPGEWLGEISVLSREMHASASVVTTSPARFLRIRHQALEDLISNHLDIAIVVLRHLVLMLSYRLGKLEKQLQASHKDAATQSGMLNAQPDPIQDTALSPPRVKSETLLEIRTFLKALPGMEGFASDQLDTLEHLLQMQMYPKNHDFTVQGESSDRMYLVVDGAVAMRSKDPLTNEVTTNVLRTGEWFGLLSLTDNLTAFETCTAMESVTVAALTRSDFNDLFESAPPVGRYFLYMLANQLARIIQGRNKTMRAQL